MKSSGHDTSVYIVMTTLPDSSDWSIQGLFLMKLNCLLKSNWIFNPILMAFLADKACTIAETFDLLFFIFY